MELRTRAKRPKPTSSRRSAAAPRDPATAAEALTSSSSAQHALALASRGVPSSELALRDENQTQGWHVTAPVMEEEQHPRQQPAQQQQNVRGKRKFVRKRFVRSRDKLHTLHERLQLDVNELKQTVRDITLHRQIFETQRLIQRHVQLGSYSKIVQHYMKVFEHGLPIGSTGVDFTADCAEWSRVISTTEECAQQVHFVNKYMDENMQFGGRRASCKFLMQWARYSACHRRLTLKPLHSEVIGDETAPIVLATVKLTAYMTRKTIEMIYPHILAQEELCQKLLGNFIEYPVRMSFQFGEHGKVVQYDIDVDFVAPLLHVLGRLDDLYEVIKGALVRDSYFIGKACAVELLQESASAGTCGPGCQCSGFGSVPAPTPVPSTDKDQPQQLAPIGEEGSKSQQPPQVGTEQQTGGGCGGCCHEQQQQVETEVNPSDLLMHHDDQPQIRQHEDYEGECHCSSQDLQQNQQEVMEEEHGCGCGGCCEGDGRGRVVDGHDECACNVHEQQQQQHQLVDQEVEGQRERMCLGFILSG